jgi:hypothetical protein
MEAYVFPVAFGIVAASNILVCIAFGGLVTGIRQLNLILKDKNESQRSMEVNKVYESFQIVIDRLTSVFSVSLLFQELFFLLLIVFLVTGAVKMAEIESIILELFFYGLASVLCFIIAFQFYPMMLIKLRSTRTIDLAKYLMVKNKRERCMALKSRVLKVRPMGVHTVTLNTLCDYAVFIVSFLLMLMSANASTAM